MKYPRNFITLRVNNKIKNVDSVWNKSYKSYVLIKKKKDRMNERRRFEL